MRKGRMQEYSARVSQANRSELVVIIYEIINEEIEEALSYYQEGQMEQYSRALQTVHKFLNQLMGSLDYHYKISYELIELYTFVSKAVIHSALKKCPVNLEAAGSVMKKLQVGFEAVREQDHSKPVMSNTQKLYAGLTYGKGTLNECSVNVTGQNRGFQA